MNKIYIGTEEKTALTLNNSSDDSWCYLKEIKISTDEFELSEIEKAVIDGQYAFLDETVIGIINKKKIDLNIMGKEE